MSISSTTTIPSKIIAGDSLSLSLLAPDGCSAAEGWTLSLTLVPFGSSGAAKIVTTTGADPDNAAAFLLSVPSVTTSSWSAGEYSWVTSVSKASERSTFASGRTAVQADPATATTLDLRTTARKVLDAIDAYLADASNLDAASYTIAGRSLSRFPRAELIAERSRWQSEVAREEAAARMAAGLSDRRRVYVRWGA